jgi:DNA-binding NarL/FixJ family response regulator
MLGTHEQLQVVGEAVDGLDAIEQAWELIPDLILMDIGLPDLNGIDAARRIGHLLPSAKIIFLTQNVDVDVIKAAMSNRARGNIVKEDAASELLPAVEAVMRGEMFVSARLNGLRRTGPRGYQFQDLRSDQGVWHGGVGGEPGPK